MTRKLALPVVVAGLSLAFPASAQAQTDLEGFATGALMGAGMLLLAVMALLFWAFMLADLMKREESQFPNPTGNKKTIWLVTLVISFFLSLHWLAATLYYFRVKRGHTVTNSAS